MRSESSTELEHSPAVYWITESGETQPEYTAQMKLHVYVMAKVLKFLPDAIIKISNSRSGY